MKSKRHFVIDTNVLVSALLFKGGKPWKAVSEVFKNGSFLFSSETLEELIEVLSRGKFDRYVSIENRQEYINILIENAIFLKPKKKITACRDPKDNKFLELAVTGNAEFIITGDDDLIVLNPFQNIPILKPDDFTKIDL